jgi:Uma2 family endonuclease
MAVEPKPHLGVRDYLLLERRAETKSEYLDGLMVGMVGGSLRHSLIAGNLVGHLGSQLRHSPCQVHPSDLRVRIPSANVYTYPDVTVVCGEPRLEDEHGDTLLNPMMVVEVLSPTTEAYDRGTKLRWYQSLESLSDYLLVSQDLPRVEHYVRHDGDGWLFHAVEGLEAVLRLPSLGIELELAEVYAKVVFG